MRELVVLKPVYIRSVWEEAVSSCSNIGEIYVHNIFDGLSIKPRDISLYLAVRNGDGFFSFDTVAVDEALAAMDFCLGVALLSTFKAIGRRSNRCHLHGDLLDSSHIAWRWTKSPSVCSKDSLPRWACRKAKLLSLCTSGSWVDGSRTGP